ncbi:LOW QUALITY PROTEIN: hypothetical protein V1478_010744 [Vespula squamosa]|uniref:Uncharacterized protein n=1 Tax=Vespula squamosa TaxID=30214 RepID=A0ABD2AF76_VESSQ
MAAIFPSRSLLYQTYIRFPDISHYHIVMRIYIFKLDSLKFERVFEIVTPSSIIFKKLQSSELLPYFIALLIIDDLIEIQCCSLI